MCNHCSSERRAGDLIDGVKHSILALIIDSRNGDGDASDKPAKGSPSEPDDGAGDRPARQVKSTEKGGCGNA